MKYRIMKFLRNSSYFLLLWLTVQCFAGMLDWSFAAAALALSGFWLLYTFWQLRQLFRTYYDLLSRLQILLPLWLGLLLSGLVLAVSTSSPQLKAFASIQLLSWAYIYWLYRRNRRRYIQQGHGPLPVNCWLNPPPHLLKPGDLVLTSGPISRRISESLDHGEVVLKTPDDTMVALSSYMPKGVVINPLEKFIGAYRRRGEHYVVLRLKKLLTQPQVEQAYSIAMEMRAQNEAWRVDENKKREELIYRLPLLPRTWKAALLAKFKATGYDFLGLFIGHRAPNRWTCIGACLELYARLGIRTHQYGTGLFGLGTGFLDPIMPVRFLGDPAFYLLTNEHKTSTS